MYVTSICIIAFLLVLSSAIAIIVIWRVTKPEPGSCLTAKEALEELRKESRLAGKVFVLFLFFPQFLSKGLFGFLALFIPAAFACLGAICESGVVEWLTVVREMLKDVYSFVENLVGKP